MGARQRRRRRARAWRSSRRPAPSRHTLNGIPDTAENYIVTCLQEVKPEEFNDTTAALGQRYYECLSAWDPHYVAQVCSPTWAESLRKLFNYSLIIIPPHYMRDGQAKRSSTKPAESGAARATVATGEYLFQVKTNNYRARIVECHDAGALNVQWLRKAKEARGTECITRGSERGSLSARTSTPRNVRLFKVHTKLGK